MDTPKQAVRPLNLSYIKIEGQPTVPQRTLRRDKIFFSDAELEASHRDMRSKQRNRVRAHRSFNFKNTATLKHQHVMLAGGQVDYRGIMTPDSSSHVSRLDSVRQV